MTAIRPRACARAPKRSRLCCRRLQRAERDNMRRPQRLIAATIVIALSSALAGCGSSGSFDPSDLLDFLDTKKKLPGERKPVFPDGVPGLEQGVPKDLYKGAHQQQVVEPNAQTVAAPPLEPPRGSKSKSAKSR